jgi:TFIIF-interacting CTD phosphatase-like protein
MDEYDVRPRNLDTTVSQENSIEYYNPQEILLEELGVVEGNKLLQLQRHDPTLKTCRDKVFKNASLVENEPKAFYWENYILKRKSTSKKKKTCLVHKLYFHHRLDELY